MSGPLTERRFGSFPELSADTVSLLSDAGFEYATPVQAAVLPLFFGNKDVVVDACTGSGKTLAFLLPVLEKLRRLKKGFVKHDVLFVVISPTRELAIQTFHVAHPFFEKLTKMTIRKLVGGSEVGTDVKEVNEMGANVIIGTPGRINDIMKKKTRLNFSALEILVLDEADRLLDLGFEVQLLEIIHALPKQRRTGLFSATQAEACETLVKAGLRNPLRVNVTTTLTSTSQRVKDFAQKTPQSLSISAVVVPIDQKLDHLVHFVQNHPTDKMIVYGLTCACIDYWFYVLRRIDALKCITIRALHGRMQQNGREKAIKAFNEDMSGVLLATDVAARGLDIPTVHWVLQLDAPQDPNAFVHRVGRTARMGREGKAIIYLAPNEETYIKFLQLRKIPIEREYPIDAVVSHRAWLRQLSETEREAMLKGVTAYTSYIRAYGNHHCPYIFNLRDVDLGQLAYAFGLLYLPGMKEIKVKSALDFVPSTKDPHSVAFVDKAREADRQQKLVKLQDEHNVMQTEKVDQKGKQSKRKATAEAGPSERPKKSRNPNKRDLEELEADYKIYRLEKRGKIKPTNDDIPSSPTAEQRPPPVTSHVQTTAEETITAAVRAQPIKAQTSKRNQRNQQVPAKSTRRDALRQSLREKLDSLKKSRQIKPKHRR